jgi:hypothetical protein
MNDLSFVSSQNTRVRGMPHLSLFKECCMRSMSCCMPNIRVILWKEQTPPDRYGSTCPGPCVSHAGVVQQ